MVNATYHNSKKLGCSYTVCTMYEHKLHIHQAGEIACEPDLNCDVLSFQPILG
jgi:hypothetical protein